MKKLNDLKNERTLLIEDLNSVAKNEELSTEERGNSMDEIDAKIEDLNKEIVRAERLDALNKTIVEKNDKETIRTDNTPADIGLQFRDFLNEAVNNGGPTTFRADPIITSTDAGTIPKEVKGIDVMSSPAFSMLQGLGVKFMTELEGTVTLPYSSAYKAVWPAESGDASTADMSTTSLTLTARRVSHFQSISRETLGTEAAGLWNMILTELTDGIADAVASDVFDTIQTDAPGSVHATSAGRLSYGDLVQFEASIGDLGTGPMHYVTTPVVKGYLKSEKEYGTDRKPIWENNEVNGYPAVGTSHANTNKVYFGDFSKSVVGSWGGGIEIIVDPYSLSTSGAIKVTAVALFDTVQRNPNAIVWSDDVSAGY